MPFLLIPCRNDLAISSRGIHVHFTEYIRFSTRSFNLPEISHFYTVLAKISGNGKVRLSFSLEAITPTQRYVARFWCIICGHVRCNFMHKYDRPYVAFMLYVIELFDNKVSNMIFNFYTSQRHQYHRPDTWNCWCACVGNAGNVFPPPRVSDPDMHHGTCVAHAGIALTSSFLWSRRQGQTFPAFPAHAQPTNLRIW